MTAVPADDAPAFKGPKLYAGSQIALHWIIALLVLGQYLFADAMAETWEAMADPAIRDIIEVPTGATLHAVFGLTILALALARLGLRLTRGAPPIPPSHPLPIRVLAYATHFSLYAFLVMMPVSGAAAWFGGVYQAATAHVIAKNLLMAFVAFHVLGAVVEVFYFRHRAAKQMVTLGAAS